MRGDRPDLKALEDRKLQFTPHARGSTAWPLQHLGPACVYPACAGIDLLQQVNWHRPNRLPRMRGDRPVVCVAKSLPDMFTPHARGSTADSRQQRVLLSVYPACAGIDHLLLFHRPVSTGLPRMRGDRPSPGFADESPVAFTPHARGSTRPEGRFWFFRSVYPACAGIDPVSR